MTSNRYRASMAVLGLAALCVMAWPVRAQNALESPDLPTGLEAEPEEIQAWATVRDRKFIRAREQADSWLAVHPESYVGHLVLGHVQHYAEANFPRALFHMNNARRLFEERHSSEPGLEGPWRWHANILRELSAVHGVLEHHGDRLAYIARFNELYEPDMVAERSWPLMKLGRFKEARLAAQLGLRAQDRPTQRRIALNSLCAIEFEAGKDGASYEACKAAVDDLSGAGFAPSAVDLTNFAEASRSMFKLDEAERVNLQATTARLSWYGNPWMELAELYTRQGRFPEALDAMRKVPEYRQRRPPHVRDADRNEMRRVVGQFLLAVARPEQAMVTTAHALALPDRRGHNSRDPAQDRVVLALLDRRARLMAAELRMEEASRKPFYARGGEWLSALGLRFGAYRSAALAQRLLDDERRLFGVFRIGTATSAVMPPWMIGELVDVLGAGVVGAALERASKGDPRKAAGAYYDSVRAEVAWSNGDWQLARELAARALKSLAPSEVLLRARAHALSADASRQLGDGGQAAASYDAAFQHDPGIFRRLAIPVAVHMTSSGRAGEQVASVLESSPRFAVGAQASGLRIRVSADASKARACLSSSVGELSCAEVQAKATDDVAALAARLSREFHKQAFAPRVDLTQGDINSLDGHNLLGRDALEKLLDE